MPHFSRNLFACRAALCVLCSVVLLSGSAYATPTGAGSKSPTASKIGPSASSGVGPTAPSAAAPAKGERKVVSPTLRGTEMQFNPAVVLINGGFDILRSWSYNPNPFQRDYRDGFLNVMDNVLHPVRNLRIIGVATALSEEVFPFRALDTRHGQFVPNWFMHTFGEGMLYRKLGDWYGARGFTYPKLLGAATLLAMQLLNETVENGAFRGANQDPMADVLIFNTLGYALFTSDLVRDFFRDEIHICYWPGQASIDALSGDLINGGENYLFKVRPGPWSPVELVMYMGAQGLFGLSHPLSDGYAVTATVGYRLMELNAEYNADKTRRTMMPGGSDDWEIGLFFDQHDSLLASAIIGTKHPRLNLNIYPGLLSPGGLAFGFFLHGSEVQGWAGGMTLALSPIGLAVGTGRDHSRYAH